MKKRRDKFSQEFGELKGRYKALTDYRKCRGTVGGLYLTQLPDYLFTGEYAKQTGRMAEKDIDFAIFEVEEKIWEQWDPVPSKVVYSFPFCPWSSLSLCGNIPFSFDLLCLSLET